MIKNTANQKWTVFAFDATTGLPATGDAANITANLRLDGGAANAVDDTNPTELEDGYYVFDITQAETNADHIIICPQSSTSDIVVIGVPGAVWTTPAKQAATLAAADVSGNLPVNVTQWKGSTAPDNTGDAFARLGTNGAGLSALPWNSAWDAEVQSECTDALNAYDPPTNAEMNARTLASASYATPTNITAGTITTVTNLINAPTTGDFTTAMKTALNNATPALSSTGVSAIVTAVWSAGTRTLSSFGSLANDVRDAVWGAATRTLTAISDSAGVTTLLSRISEALSFTSGNVHTHIKAKDNLDFGALEKASLNAATPAVTVSDKTGFSLTNDYDAAKTAATQASVNAIPTTPVLASDARLNNLDATITSRLADSKYVAPANDDIAAIKAKTDNLPASPAAVGSEMVLTSAYDAAKTAASQSSVNSIPTNPLLTNDTRLNNLNATIASRLAADNYTAPANDNITAIKAVTDKLDDTLELADGKNRFTEAALAEGSAADVSAVIDDLVDGFLDAQLIGHDIVGSVGAAIAASSASGDPWATELPGTYTTGTAGNIIGTKTASAEEIREELDTRSSKFSILGRILKF